MTTWTNRIAVSAIAAFFGVVALSAQAQARGPGQQESRDNRGDARGHQPAPRVDSHRQGANVHEGPGAGPDHRWVKGGRVPQEYRGNNYVGNDWRGHRLSSPPHGYRSVQNGGDYLLVAVATGVIAQIIWGN